MEIMPNRRWEKIIPPEPVNLPQEVEIDNVLPTTHSCPNCGYQF